STFPTPTIPSNAARRSSSSAFTSPLHAPRRLECPPSRSVQTGKEEDHENLEDWAHYRAVCTGHFRRFGCGSRRPLLKCPPLRFRSAGSSHHAALSVGLVERPSLSAADLRAAGRAAADLHDAGLHAHAGLSAARV